MCKVTFRSGPTEVSFVGESVVIKNNAILLDDIQVALIVDCAALFMTQDGTYYAEMAIDS